MPARASRASKAERATEAPTPSVTPRYCSVRLPPALKLPRGIAAGRRRLILQSADKWKNNVTIRYWFFDAPRKWVGDEAQKAVVRRAFQMWKALGIGLDFAETAKSAEADVRIAFEVDDGAWSYVGTDVRAKRKDPRTMNFGWSLTEDAREGRDTALHEIGHTLGFPHEHQNPFAGIVWNEDAVYKALAKPPNSWSKAETYANILSKITPDEVQGSTWDPNSVMHYPFEKGLILKPVEYRNGLTPAGGLSARDKSWALKFYPGAKAPVPLTMLQSVPLSLSPGDQADFSFTPAKSRRYEFRTFGASDTALALFDGQGATPIAEDQDSGEDRNADITVDLTAGKTYVLRVRLQYAEDEGETAVMVW